MRLPLKGSALILLSFITLNAALAVQPSALTHDVMKLDSVDRISLPALDFDRLALEDGQRDLDGLPPRYAVPNPVSITPEDHGSWEDLNEATRMWRLRIDSPGALSINLGFTTYRLPEGARLFVYSADGLRMLRPFDAGDNKQHGELWTPVLLGDDLVIELTVPRKAEDQVQLELGSINLGYRLFGEEGDRSGACNIDVICPEGDDWRDDIPAIGVISTGGSTFCTGFMVNNTAEDQTPYFMTANHCGINTGNAPSLVVYWNFESPSCGQHGGGSLSDWQSGSTWRAGYSSSDFTLVELDDPPNTDWGITFAGWDHSGDEASTAVAIHHPNTDEKSISFEFQSTTTTSYLGTSVPGDGTHVRITDWDLGTTEPGSSGSPLFDQNHHVIGQLHGGYAACGNDLSDWFGRFSRSWSGGGSSSNRLSNWLDPIGSGAVSLDVLAPGSSGLRVSPSDGLSSSGDAGGPFSPASKSYTLENRGATGFDYSVSADQTWISVGNASGYLAGGDTTSVTVSINGSANSLPLGQYAASVEFVNATDHDGDTVRPVTLRVGQPSLVYDYPLDSDPGWATEGQWAFGQPTGGGGQHGPADPTSGHTGPNVYGYNLNGDYANNLPERHLTSTAIDCSQLSATTLKFWRRLGVETPTYDHAYVRVSADGSNWVDIWQNGDYVEDGAWQQVEYDISAVADGAATLYLRWTMGSTDSSWQYCGWNIDDVQIWGIASGPTSAPGSADAAPFKLLPNVPNPFNPKTAIRFEMAEPARVRLEIFDIAGRSLATLLEGPVGSGLHELEWNGTDKSGAGVASGIYFARLAWDGGSQTRKLTLLK